MDGSICKGGKIWGEGVFVRGKIGVLIRYLLLEEIIKMAENGGFCGFWEIKGNNKTVPWLSVENGISLHSSPQVILSSPSPAKIFFSKSFHYRRF